MEKYLGENTAFWLEVKSRLDKLNTTDYVREIADLRAKVSIYEDRIEKLNDIMIKLK